MKIWNMSERPPLDVCPEGFCFCWVPPKGTANLSGKVYDSFEASVSNEKDKVTFMHGGCAAPFGPCRRGTKNAKDKDCYEPFERVLRKHDLPELYFCNPESLVEEFLGDYELMAKEIWGESS